MSDVATRKPNVQTILALLAGIIATVSATYSITSASVSGKVEALNIKQVVDEQLITEIRIGQAQQIQRLDSIQDDVTDIKQVLKESRSTGGH
jgi:hypothetical protein